MRSFEFGQWKVIDRIIPVVEPLQVGWELPDPVFVPYKTERQVLAVYRGWGWPTDEELHQLEYEIRKTYDCSSEEIFIKALWPSSGDTIRGMNIL